MAAFHGAQVNGEFTTITPNAWVSLLTARHPAPGWQADQHASAGIAGHRDNAARQVLPVLDVAAYDDQGRRLPPGEQGELGLRAADDGPWAGWRGPLDVFCNDNSKKRPSLLSST